MSFSFCRGLDKATDEMQCALPLPRNAERKKGESHSSHGPSPASWWLDVMSRSAKRRRRHCDTSLADDDLVGLQACSMCWDGMEMLQTSGWKCGNLKGCWDMSGCPSFLPEVLVHILDWPSHFEACPWCPWHWSQRIFIAAKCYRLISWSWLASKVKMSKYQDSTRSSLDQPFNERVSVHGKLPRKEMNRKLPVTKMYLFIVPFCLICLIRF